MTKEKTKIGLYGFGYVGKAMYEFLKDHYEVVIFDPGYPEYSDMKRLAPLSHALICVPTPMNEKDGSCDTSIVENILKSTKHKYYLIKSTVVPGTTARLVKETKKTIAFSPEYIGEGKYEIPFWLDLPHPTNMKLHTFHIFGGSKDATKPWVEIWQKIAGWTARFMQSDSTTVELVKYMVNSYGATKVTFCNEFFDIAQSLGVDYNELKELWLLDGRIGRSWTMVFPDKRGFGGKCLPKDVNGIVKNSEKQGYSADLLKSVLKTNKKFRGNDLS